MINRRNFICTSGAGIGALALGSNCSSDTETRIRQKDRIFAKRFGHYQRIVLTEDNRVLKTAATELLQWLGADLPVVTGNTSDAGDIVLSLISAAAALSFIEKGLTNLHNISAEQDAFQILEQDQKLWVLGSSLRGVMQGINEIILSADTFPGDEPLNVQRLFSLKYRVFSPLIWGQMYAGEASDETVRKWIRYLSLMGASHIAVNHDFSGSSLDMHKYVESKIFPKAADPDERLHLHKRLRQIINAASDYGLGIFFDSRLLPCQGGPWTSEEKRAQFMEKFPAEVLSDSGTYQGKVLCFGHPLVQKFYKEVITNFFHDFPEIEVFHYLTMDSNGEFCDPDSCPRCHGMSKLDQRGRLSRFLAETMGAVRPGIVILNTAFQWERSLYGMDKLLSAQADLPETVGLCMAATDDSATFDRQSHEALRRARKVTARAGQPFLGRDAMHLFEDMPVKTQWQVDYPLGIFAKIRRWELLKTDGFFDVRGRVSPDSFYANSMACRAAMMNSLGDSEAFIHDLADRWFGTSAAPYVTAGWQALERGQAIRSAGYSFPSSSVLSEYFPWFLNICRLEMPLPANPNFTAGHDVKASPEFGEIEPAAANGWIYHKGSYSENLAITGQSLVDAAPCFREAANHLAKALDCSLPDNIPGAELWLGHGTQVKSKDYLQNHLYYIQALDRMDSFMGYHFLLKSLYIRVSGDAGAYKKQGITWLKSYSSAARSLADYVEEMNHKDIIPLSVSEKNWSPEILRSMAKEVDDWLS